MEEKVNIFPNKSSKKLNLFKFLKSKDFYRQRDYRNQNYAYEAFTELCRLFSLSIYIVLNF